ncbi:unnamed protein product [Closterium sp. NIES-54]
MTAPAGFAGPASGPVDHYPQPLATHEAILGDRVLFLDLLAQFHNQMGGSLRIPQMGGRELDLHLLYREVTGRGGLMQVRRGGDGVELVRSGAGVIYRDGRVRVGPASRFTLPFPPLHFLQVIADRKWRDVTIPFDFPPTTTSASYVLRKFYINLLHHFEQTYFFNRQGSLVPPPRE